MILGHIDHIETEGVLYPNIIQKGLRYLKETDFSKLADGKYKVDGDNIMAIVSQYCPDIKENRKAETHTKYIDIQYLAAGEENMGFASRADGIETPEGYLTDSDATFYQSVNNEIDITVLQGMYAVFFPWDIHRPGCVNLPDRKVRKVVLKLKVKDL